MRSLWCLSRSGSSSMATPSRRAGLLLAASRTNRGAIPKPKPSFAESLPMRRRSSARQAWFCATPGATATTPSRSISRAVASSVRSRKPRAAHRNHNRPRKSFEHNMAPYIGTSTSRIDGIAKVTGAAKYSAEFNVPGLVYGSIVSATITKGHITRIDRSPALRVKGVIDVLTHDHRPPMADNDKAYQDDVAPTTGSPFRPLYDNKIMFNGQPIALVVAETSEIARCAASLVAAEYKTESHVTDMYRQRGAAITVEVPTTPIDTVMVPPKMRGSPDQALAGAAVRHVGEYYVPIEHHNPM